ncbi:LANO_0H05644g1_1 [Lachancea nothofagi CBS 11611]|uniref:LANO_0H05644g1_1 n=1 Tax=Lachancea nothofagi CBS 11611 TaxID=1266666 RepID=A0A1G4KLS1_9SACH|nr:LANO_0H05644g1_1 [Lachancea nothofagi CBS 11611]
MAGEATESEVAPIVPTTETKQNKPASTTATNSMPNPQHVSPEKVSQLLLSEGPLAIRFITKALCKQMAGFEDLSASKQRRLIMGALETGDRNNCVVFAKIGWGQWSAKKVDSPENFESEREVINIANSKVKDMVSQERRKSSSVQHPQARKASLSLKRELDIPNGNRPTYLDENALASEDEDEDNGAAANGKAGEFYEGDDFNDQGHQTTLPYDFFKRRKSSVVYAENSPPDDSELDNASKTVRPILKNYRRSSWSKKRSPSVGKRGSFRGSNVSLEATTNRRLSSPAHAGDEQTNKESDGIDKHTRGREPRLSFSKESSLRSTLLSHASYRSSPIQRPIDLPLHKDLAYKLNSLSPDANNVASSNGEDDVAVVDEDGDGDHSDTDEEDWKQIGAESLRNSRATSQVRSPHSPAINNSLLDHHPSHLSLSPSALHEASQSVPKSEAKKSPKQEPQAQGETQDAAFLLMSLKS